MQKKITALSALLLLTILLLSGCGKTDSAAGIYYAASCSADGTDYDCFGEYLMLEDDGSGTIMYNGKSCDLSYSYDSEGKNFTFKTDDGVSFGGVLSDNGVEGIYGRVYTYRYLPIGADDGVDYSGEYQAIHCYIDGVPQHCEEDVLVLQSDGTGTAAVEGTVHEIMWRVHCGWLTVFGDGFTLENAVYQQGEISGSFFGADYVFSDSPIVVTAGSYGAVSVSGSDDGSSYYLNGECLTLASDGSGSFTMGETNIPGTWELFEGQFSFTSDSGSSLVGSYTEGSITAVLNDEYRYVFQLGSAPVQQSCDLGDTVAEGFYGVVSCKAVESGGSVAPEGEYLVLESDGTGVFYFVDEQFRIEWFTEEDNLLFQAAEGYSFTGGFDNGEIEGKLNDTFRFTFRYGTVPVTN